MVIGAPCAGGGILTAGSARARCEGATSRGTLGCASAPDMKVSCAGGATSFVRFTCPWDISVVVTSSVSGDNPCGLGVADTIVLKVVQGLS